jgi:alkylation response protein AidB-like acyl-CoA dehydrogenase
METIERYGLPEHKKRWLEPLLDGKIRSAFAMTEPAVASSDATNIASRIERQGDDYVINGPQVVIRVRRPALQDLRVHGQDRPRGTSPLAAVDDPGAGATRRDQGAASAAGLRLRRRAARHMEITFDNVSRAGRATSCSARAAASRSRRGACGRAHPPLHGA